MRENALPLRPGAAAENPPAGRLAPVRIRASRITRYFLSPMKNLASRARRIVIYAHKLYSRHFHARFLPESEA